MPLLNITFWFLSGLIVGWFLASWQDDTGNNAMELIFHKEPTRNLQMSQSPATDDDKTKNGGITHQPEDNNSTIKQFEESLQTDGKAAVVIYQQVVQSGGEYTQQMRDRLLARIIALMRQHRYRDAQQLIDSYLDSNAYDAEALLLQAQLYNVVDRRLEALNSAYDAKIYGDRSVEEAVIDRLIAKILGDYEKHLIENKEWNSLVALYSLVVERDYSEQQPSYYYKLAHAQFKLGDYYTALASLSQIIGNSLWNRKALYFQQTIEKFIDGDGIIAIPVTRVDPHKFLITATVNDTIEAELLIDTGASLSILRESFITEVELPINDEAPLTLTTASDTVEARTIRLDSFGINEVKFADMTIGITEMPDDFLPDGLLGMDYLSKFEFNLDQEALVLYLYSL